MPPDAVPARGHLDELNQIGSLPGPVAEACFTAYRDAHAHLIDFGKLGEPIRGYKELPYNNPAIRAALVAAYAAGRASVLDGAEEEWAVRNPDGDCYMRWLGWCEEDARAYAQQVGEYPALEVITRHVTPWRPADSGTPDTSKES